MTPLDVSDLVGLMDPNKFGNLRMQCEYEDGHRYGVHLIRLAMEWGFRHCEGGNNLDHARLEFEKILQKERS